MGIFIENLQNLRKYKYSSEDHSLLSNYVLKPYWWSKFANVFPSTLAPNAVTLSGFAFVIVNLFTCLYYDLHLGNPDVPTWATVSYAVGMFMYQTFDACDGIQARKTGQSGPLGELFDHCVDAINTTLSTIIFASVTKMGYGWIFLFGQFACLANFYLSTWEEFHTKKLFLTQFSGPVEGILMIVLLMLLTAYLGNDIWLDVWYKADISSFATSYIPEPLLFKLVSLGTVSVGEKDTEFWLNIDSTMLFALMESLIGFNIYAGFGNVRNLYKNEPEKYNTALKGLLPFVKYYALVFSFAILSKGYVFGDCFLSLVLQIGLSTAFNVGRIITCHLTLSEFPYHIPTIYVPVVQVLAVALIRVGILDIPLELAVNCLCWAGFGLSLGIHGCFIAEIIYEISTFLDINVLTIKHPKKTD